MRLVFLGAIDLPLHLRLRVILRALRLSKRCLVLRLLLRQTLLRLRQLVGHRLLVGVHRFTLRPHVVGMTRGIGA